MISSGFASPDEIAALAAGMLVDVNAIHFNVEEPFTLASGLPSPVYVDCRRLISYPRLRSILMDFMAATAVRKAGAEAFDCVAGGETAGIPFAALVAERLGLPMAYVRKKPKGYGRNAQIEGVVKEGDRVLLVEDLATDGGSKIKFVNALREAGAECSHAAVIFSYGIFPQADALLAESGISLHSLCSWEHVFEAVEAKSLYGPSALAEVRSFLGDPDGWRASRGS